MSIRESRQKIKGFLDILSGDALPIIALILVAFIAFGMGRLSALEASESPVELSQAPTEDIEPLALGGHIVASRKGSKYHFPWCPGAEQMNPSNKIWFESEEEARASGYTPAGNCKGLK